MRLGPSSSNLFFGQVLSAEKINFSSSQQRSLSLVFSYFHDIVHPHYIVGMRGFGRIFITFSQLAPDEGVVIVALVVGVAEADADGLLHVHDIGQLVPRVRVRLERAVRLRPERAVLRHEGRR